MDQDQSLGCIRIDLKFFQAFQKIFRVLGVSVEQGTDDKLLFVRLMSAVLAKFLFPDQEAGDALCQKGVFAYFFRGTGDADYSQKTVFMVKRHVDTLAGSCKIIGFCHFDGSTGYSSFPADFMKSSDPLLLFFLVASAPALLRGEKLLQPRPVVALDDEKRQVAE